MTSPTDRVQGGNPLFADAMLPPVNPFLGLLPKKYWPLEKKFFTYTITYKTGSPNQAPVLAASAVQQSASTNINGDSDFLLMAITGVVAASDDSSIVASPPFTLQVFDSSASQALSDFPVHWLNTVGTAQNPAFLPFPRVFAKNGIITTQISNFVATARNVYLAFVGFKIFPTEPQS